MIVGHAGEMPFDITKWLTLKGATIKGIYGRKVWDTWSDRVLRRLQAKPPAGEKPNGPVGQPQQQPRRKRFGRCEIDLESRRMFEVGETVTQIQSGAGKVLFLPNP